MGMTKDEDLGCDNGDNWWLNSLESTLCKEIFPIDLDNILRLKKAENIQSILELQGIQEI